MSKIAIQNMSYYYEDFYHPVFENVNLILDTDWKTGLIGRNGRGKTTFFKLLSGELAVTEGAIAMPGQTGYFPYKWNEKFEKTMDVVKENIGGIRSMELEMEALLGRNDEESLQVYFKLLEQYQRRDGYEMESRIYKEVEKMKLDPAILEHDFSTLSGGEKSCMLMISLFLRKEGFVLLDEPTNHLDEQRKQAVAEYLNRKKGFLVVSHDTDFLNQVVDHILAINKANINLEQGNYATWRKIWT